MGADSVAFLVVARLLRMRFRPGHFGPRPQQEPGPAHPVASYGRLPQQPWSAGPGISCRAPPVRGLVGDMSFSTSRLLQAGQLSGSVALNTRSSPRWPHWRQWMSKMGMGCFILSCESGAGSGFSRTLRTSEQTGLPGLLFDAK